MMHTERTNFWSGLTVFLASGLLIVWVIPAFVGKGFGGAGFGAAVSPKFMPTFGALIMMAASAMTLVRAFITLRRAGEPLWIKFPPMSFVRRVWPFAFVALFITVISVVGLVYSGPFLIAALLLILGERRPMVLLPAAILPPVLIWLLATQLMRIGMV